MLRRKEEYQHFFSVMAKVLKAEPFTGSPEEQQFLLRLIENPALLLNADQEKQYASIQENLRHPDPEVQRLTRLAISLDILSCSQISKKLARKLSKCGQSGTYLDLSSNHLSALGAAEWQAFCTAIQQSHITSLNLGYNNLSALGDAEWQVLCTAIQQSHITSLSLYNNHLSALSAAEWQVLCTAIQQSHITSLNLGNNNLSALGAAEWQVLCTAIQQLHITSLNLNVNNLSRLGAAEWQVLCTAVQQSHITSLDLHANNLSRLGAAEWQAFCTAIQQSHITSLNLGYNNLSALGAAEWQAFFTGLQQSPITHLDLSGNGLSVLNADQWQTFSGAIKDNFSLYRLELDDETSRLMPPEVTAYLQRNRQLYDASELAKSTLAKDIFTKQDFTVTIDSLDKAIALLNNNDSPLAQARQRELQDLQGEVYWKQVGWLRDQAFKKSEGNKPSSEALTDLHMQVIQAYCAIPPQNNHYTEARSEAFQLAYTDYFNAGYSQQQAFLNALPCLLDEQHFIKFDDDTQKVIDDFLLKAAGMEKKGLQGLSLLPEPNKLALLQYVWLMEIKNIASELSETQSVSDTASAAGLFAPERAGGLRDFLNKELNAQPDSFNKAMEKLWGSEETERRIQNSHIPLDDNLIYLKTAISNLAKEINPPQQAPDSNSPFFLRG